MPHSTQRKRNALEGEMMEYTMSLYRNKDDMISDMRAEITQLRADLDRAINAVVRIGDRYQRDCLGLNSEGDPIGGDPPVGWRQRAEIAEAELERERELADRLASSVEWFLSETETYRGDEPMDDHGGLSWNQINEYWIRHEDIAADILTAHATRRNK